MTSRPERGPRRPRTAGAIVRGLVALVMIIVLLVGIPVALIAITGSPLPASMPTWDEVGSALMSPDDGSLFLGALVLLAWLGWASFAIGVLVEIPAALRGRKAPRIPVLGVQQRAAAGLIAAVAALFAIGPVGVATAMPAQPHTEIVPVAAAAADDVTNSQAAGAARSGEPAARETSATPDRAHDVAAPAAAPTTRTHIVEHGESLWRIAEEELGDGARWPEIARLNYGVSQPDGRALDHSHWLEPGWRIEVPAPEKPEPTPTSTTEQAATTHVVVEGDTLWDIAQDKLGDGSRYPEIFAASCDTVQPDGHKLTDPDLIMPGWSLTVPAADGSTSPPPQEKEPDRPKPDQPHDEKPEPPVEPPVDENPPVDEHQPDVEQPPVEEDTGSGGEEDSEASQPDQDTTEAAGDEFPVRTAAGVGSLLAAGVLAFVAARRRSQQRHRRIGERIAMPEGDAAAEEQELRGVADPMSVETVDLALRGLAANCAYHRVALPPLRIARLTSEQFELYFTDGADLPAPFVATDEPHVWFLPADAGSELNPDELQDVAAPYPGLVTIGHGPEDGHLLLNLERLGTLTLTGPDDTAQQVMAALAVELATSPWADDLQVTLVGTCPELAGGLDTGRVRHLPSVGSLLDDLSRRAEHDRAALTEHGADSLDEARSRGVAPATWTPEIVLLAEPLTGSQRDRLVDLVDSMPRVAVAAVTREDDVVGTWALQLDDDDPDSAILQPVEVDVSPQRLDDEQYRRILDILGITGLPSVPAPPDTSGLYETPTHESPADEAPIYDAPAYAAPDYAVPDDAAPAYEPPTIEPDPEREVRSLPFDGLEPAAAVVPSSSASIGNGAEPHMPGADLHEPEADGPTIMLLGPVEVEDAEGPVEASKYRQLTEIAAYIALHPGLGYAALDEAIWPGNRVTQNTRNTAISKLRRWFGQNEHGDDYLPRVDTGYRFAAGVSTDWDRWLRLVGPDPAIAGTDDLVRALELVRGQPFTGVNPRRYAWAEHLKQEMISAIVDTAHMVAERGIRAGNAHLARKAATIGLQAEPGMEILWRDRIKAEHLAGNRAGLEDAVARVTAISDDFGDVLEDATTRLIDQLLHGREVGVPSEVELSGRF